MSDPGGRNRVFALVAQQARTQAVLDALSADARRERALPSAGDHDLVERGCACGASLRALVPHVVAGEVARAWDTGHTSPRCRPVSLVAAFELRHERNGVRP